MGEQAGFPFPMLGSVRRYLLAHGWHRTALSTAPLDLFSLREPGFDDVEIVLPQSSQTPDVDKRIVFALRTLAGIESRPLEDVAAAIRAIGYDVMRARLPDALVFRESIRLRIAEDFIRNTRRLLADTAGAEAHPGRYFARTPKEGEDFVSECRFGHTFRGSFGFAIETPIGPSSEPTLTEDERPPIFNRRVMQRIIRGLRDVERAGLQSDPRPILSGFEVGFNANMCDALVSLFESSESEELAFEFLLSPEWKPAADVLPNTRFSMRARTVAVVREAAEELKREIVDVPTIIQGKIIRLESRDNPADLLQVAGSREITVEWQRGDMRATTIRVRLAPTDYLRAVRAHEEGRQVVVSGNIERSGRSFVITHPTKFDVIM